MLWKKATLLGLTGFVLGIMIWAGFALTGGSSEGLGDAFPHLLLGGLYGAVAMGGSVAYDVEKWSIARATATHFLLMFGLYCLLVLSMGWFRIEDPVFWIVIAVMAVGYILIWLLHRDDGWTHLDFKALKITKNALRDQLAMGVPSALQGCLFNLSNMLIQSSVVSLNNLYYPGGSAIIDGNAAGSSLESFLYTCAFSCNQAAVTFTSQHLGARKYARMRRVRRTCLIVSSALCMLLGLIMLLFRRQIVSIYVTDPHSMETAFIRMSFMVSTYFFAAAMETVSGFLRGLGRSLLSTVNSLLGACLFRILWISIVFNAFPRLEMIYISYPISWALTALLSFTAGERTLRRLEREYDAENGPAPA